MKAWVFGGMLVLSAALAACSSSSTDGAGGGSGGGSGEGGNGDGGSGSATTGTNTGSTTNSTGATPTTTSTTTSTTTGGNTCSIDIFFGEPTCDGCMGSNCCDEMEACIADAEAGNEGCILQDGSNQFSDGPLADAVFACLESSCSDECGGGGICGTGLATQDDALNECLGQCCDEFTACMGVDGSNLEQCNACLEAGEGALCDDLIACDAANECGFVPHPICESGLSVGDPEIAECLGTNCCDEFTACTGDGSDAAIQACIDCVNDPEGGALCDAAVACADTNSCFPE